MGAVGLIILLFLEVIIVGVFVCIYWSDSTSWRYGAPYIPVSRNLIQQVLSFGNIRQDDVFYDLGSGDSRILLAAVRLFKVRKAVGYEAATWPYLKSKFLIRAAGLEKKITVFRENFFGADIREATFIYMYLFPGTVDKLAKKIATECQPGVRVLSLRFPIGNQKFRLLDSRKINRMTAYLYERI